MGEVGVTNTTGWKGIGLIGIAAAALVLGGLGWFFRTRQNGSSPPASPVHTPTNTISLPQKPVVVDHYCQDVRTGSRQQNEPMPLPFCYNVWSDGHKTPG